MNKIAKAISLLCFGIIVAFRSAACLHFAIERNFSIYSIPYILVAIFDIATYVMLIRKVNK